MSTDRKIVESETIDRLRPLLALMVVGLHVRPYYTTGTETFFDGLYEASVITIYRVLFSVAVPFFFLISGYYFFKGMEEWDLAVWKGKIKKRVGSLLVPYLLWNIIALVGYFFTRLSGHIIKGAPIPYLFAELGERGWLRIFWDRCLYGDIRTDKVNLFGYAVSTGTPMNEPTWFLRDLMVVILFTPLIWWLIRHFKKNFILLFGLLYVVDLWIPFAGFSSKAFFLFSLGAWLMLNGKNLVSVSGKYPRLLASLSLLLLILSSMSFGTNEWLYCISSRLFILCAIPVLFQIVSKKVAWDREGRATEVRKNLSKCSFFIYVIHTVLITDAINWAFASIVHSQNKMVLFILLTVCTLIVFFTCYTIWLLMNRFTPNLLNVLTGNRSSRPLTSNP